MPKVNYQKIGEGISVKFMSDNPIYEIGLSDIGLSHISYVGDIYNSIKWGWTIFRTLGRY